MRCTKVFLYLNSLTLGILGLTSLFLPKIALKQLPLPHPPIEQLFIIQMMGGLYLALAMMSWMSKEKPTGGIYNRPLVMANFIHYLIGFTTLLKMTESFAEATKFGLAFGGLYLFFTLSFGLLLFRSPV